MFRVLALPATLLAISTTFAPTTPAYAADAIIQEDPVPPGMEAAQYGWTGFYAGGYVGGGGIVSNVSLPGLAREISTVLVVKDLLAASWPASITSCLRDWSLASKRILVGLTSNQN